MHKLINNETEGNTRVKFTSHFPCELHKKTEVGPDFEDSLTVHIPQCLEFSSSS